MITHTKLTLIAYLILANLCLGMENKSNAHWNERDLNFEVLHLSQVELVDKSFWKFLDSPPLKIKFELPWLEEYAHGNKLKSLKEEFLSLEKKYFKEKMQVKYPGHFTMAEANAKRNRFDNVLPFDSNLVIVQNSKGEEVYVNASRINPAKIIGEGFRFSYPLVVTQAPMADSAYELPDSVSSNTWSEFFRMAWDEESSVIVNLTGYEENYYEQGKFVEIKHKSEKYWPELKLERITDDLTIANVGEKSLGNIDMIVLKLTKNSEERYVLLLHYPKWPDDLVPPGNLLDDLLTIKLLVDAFSTKSLIVHCSAGRRRSGTFAAMLIAADYVLKTGKQPDLSSMIERMQKPETGRFGLVGYVEYCELAYLGLIKYCQKYREIK